MNYLDNIDGIIFDLDGTLIDSMGVWENLASEFLRKNKIVANEGLEEIIKTMTLRESSKYLIDEYNLDYTIEEVIINIKDIVFDAYKYDIKAKDCVYEYLDILEKKNLKMMILTASEKELVEICLKRLGLTKYFDHIITCGDVNLSKNNPEIYILASNLINAKPERVLIFEDSYHCVKAAKKANVKVVAVKDEYSLKDEINIKKLADYYINSFCDIL